MNIMVDDHVFSSKGPSGYGRRSQYHKERSYTGKFLEKGQSPTHPAGANETKLKAGNLYIRGTCTMEGKAVVGQQPVKIQCALHMYEADISVQAILSYKWLAD